MARIKDEYTKLVEIKNEIRFCKKQRRAFGRRIKKLNKVLENINENFK